jgi:hypothetical protein
MSTLNCFKPYVGIVMNERGNYSLRIHSSPDRHRDIGNYPTYGDAIRRAVRSGYILDSYVKRTD